MACTVVLCACSQGSPKKAQNEFSGSSLNDTQQATPAPTAASSTATTTSTATIAIDAGHQAQGDSSKEPIGPGASETKAKVTDGAEGISSGTPESEINLAIAFKLQADLQARGLNVVMCRTAENVDISNSERAAVANNAGAALFIRLHCDGIDDNTSTNGCMTLIPGENTWTSPIVDSSAKAADIIHPLIISRTGATDRGIVERTDLSGFNWCTVPTVLFEVGCLSNPTEDVKLNSDSYQQTIADAIADGTVTYLNSR